MVSLTRERSYFQYFVDYDASRSSRLYFRVFTKRFYLYVIIY